MKTTAILVAIAMIAMVTPTQAAETVDNTAVFKAITAEKLDGEINVNDPALDPIWAALNERANGRDMSFLLEGAEEGGSFPAASGWFELFEFAITDGPTCSQGGGGNGGHYTVATSNPGVGVPGNPTWPLMGAATSDISTISGLGFFYDFNTGTSFSYSQAVTYAGTSDFFCFEFDFFGIFFVYNWPYVSGAVA